MPVLLTRSVDCARAQHPALTVEAEYGGKVVEGSVYTAAHHQQSGPYAGTHVEGGARPAPCNDPNIPILPDDAVVVVSHLDMDTIGGVLRARAACADLFDPAHAEFWRQSEWVDVHGPHRFDESHAEGPRMRAAWAWLDAHDVTCPDNAVVDITDHIDRAASMLRTLLTSGPDVDALLAQGALHRKLEQQLAETSLKEVVQSKGGRVIAVREADAYINHLYRVPGHPHAAGIVAFNPVRQKVSISLWEAIPGVSCCAIVQGLWGEEAGGHATIAGSPRDRVMTRADAADVLAALADAI